MLELKEMGVRARQAARTLATAGEAEKNAALEAVAGRFGGAYSRHSGGQQAGCAGCRHCRHRSGDAGPARSF